MGNEGYLGSWLSFGYSLPGLDINTYRCREENLKED